ncbi:DUF2971 domain-containing protein [Pseudomonas libanensis]|uniref:DUF2971 domain-containing protein n=1 Tax=Pseudomonas libanensis TaxID=75588 RepID=A0ABR5M3T1_9PSED|nr:DUF2971 domain-containing protein [Pseudomonas libanensis]KPG72884.1 hypothetical protein AEQ48_20470 [Pseudomonas libanensis]
MRCYHFLNEQYGLEAIKNKRLKVSTFDSVNDPFELFCHSLGNRELRKRMSTFKASASSISGMICFSKSMNSPVQWAHYADRHKGICLGFDIPDVFLEAVKYVSERLDFHLERPWAMDKTDPRVNECFVTKYDHWRYEEEVRLFGELGNPDQENGLYFFPFNKDMRLVEVIVGSSSNITEQKIIESLSSSALKAKVHKVRPAFRRFAMVRHLSLRW